MCLTVPVCVHASSGGQEVRSCGEWTWAGIPPSALHIWGDYRKGHDKSVALGPICAAERGQASLQKEQEGREGLLDRRNIGRRLFTD